MIKGPNKLSAAKRLVIGALASSVLVPTLTACSEDDPHKQIYGGVASQVETHSTAEYCASYIKAICIDYDTAYYLGVEQNSKDVINARNGQSTTSFDPKVGEVYPDSAYNTVKVSSQTWQAFPDGTTITFDGQPTKQIQD